MLINARNNLLVLHCLRCWDQSDEPIESIVWFNSDTMVASARRGRDEVPVQVSRFCFRTSFPTTTHRLRIHLPEPLHRFIEEMESVG